MSLRLCHCFCLPRARVDQPPTLQLVGRAAAIADGGADGTPGGDAAAAEAEAAGRAVRDVAALVEVNFLLTYVSTHIYFHKHKCVRKDFG